MTTHQPAALPELSRGQIIDLISPLSNNSADHDIEFAHRVIAALQSQQSTQGDTPAAAGVSDAEWWHDVLGLAGPDLLNLAKQWSDNEVHVYQFVNEAEKIVKAAAQRAILALRPQAVPMTEHERGNHVMEHLGPAALTGGRMSVLDAFNLGIDAAEAHHGITAQGAQGGEG